MREYTVSQDKNGYWYAHQTGYPSIPVWGSFSKSKRHAMEYAAASMCLTYKEFMEYRKKRG